MSEFQVIQPGSISEWAWQEKYRFGNEASIDDTFRRVATWLAGAEPADERAGWAETFYAAMRDFEFLPAGRILAGAGTDRQVTASNCFVMGRIEDSLDGIMSALREAALTLKQGGGVGMDFSTLRPRGAPVKGVDSVSSGAVSFMDLWNTMCGTIRSAGDRRGAQMGCLRVGHPDIEEFIAAKSVAGRLTNFNLSVLITDDFMRAVETGALWSLVFDGKHYGTVDARGLWDRITALTYEHAEPGVLFIDRMNEDNPLRYCETLYATNPCGEEPLPPYGACILGSINLARLVARPFERTAVLDFNRLRRLVSVAVRMLDNVNDLSNYPLSQQREEARLKRRIGLGITGLADALILLGQRYGSGQAVALVDKIMDEIRRSAEVASQALGAEKGSFPLFEAEHYGCSHRRNSHLLSIAPTGTISLVAGNISGGIEPTFEWTYKRRVLQDDGSHREWMAESYAARLANHLGVAPMGDAWVTTDDLGVEEHLTMMAAAQAHVDAAISKTVNCPGDMPLAAFRDVYRRAYDLGLKGCATYRPSPTRGAVLVRDKPEPPEPLMTDGNVTRLSEPLVRPEMLHGTTYKIKPTEHALYVTVNDMVIAGRRRPFELFLSSKEAEGHAWRVALSRMISAILRKGGEVGFVADELRAVFDPRGGWWQDGRYIASQPAAIGEVLARHMQGLGLLEGAIAPAAAKRHCPKCQTGGLIAREGCLNCDRCDYSKC